MTNAASTSLVVSRLTWQVIEGDTRDGLRSMPERSVHCCVTSPPYWGLRDYGHDGQIGLEQTPDEYVAQLVEVFREVRRVLRDDGTLWLNLGDSYASTPPGNKTKGVSARSTLHGVMSDTYRETLAAGHAMKRDTSKVPGVKPKDLIGIPWRVAFALQADGWYLRQDIIWAKPNPMPESVTDRCTKAHEYIFLLSKSERYYFDAEAISEEASPNTNPRRSKAALTAMAEGVGQRNGPPGNPPPRDIGIGHNARPRKAVPNNRDGQGFKVKNNESMDAALAVMPERRNKRSVWTVGTEPFSGAHFATMPPSLAELCIKAGCPEAGTVLDPFGGAGTTGLVADRLQRDALLIELNPDYSAIAQRRVAGDAPLFADVEVQA